MSALYAHSREGLLEEEWQTLGEHLHNVAALAEGFAASFGAGECGRALGLLHDAGKCREEFQRRLRGEAIRADHSTAGAWYARDAFPGVGQLLAYAIAGHHAGLPDGTGANDASLAIRLRNTFDLESIADLLPRTPPNLPNMLFARPADMGFRVSFFIRMLFSCLVDADFLDTERFMDRGRAEQRTGWPSLAELETRLRPKLNVLLRESSDTPLNRSRRAILARCLETAEADPGLFSLTVPTGGGKTLSSLAFALRHALQNGLDRIIYVIPFTSIIEQNASVFRDYLGTDAVLEHHSNFDPENTDESPSEALRRSRFASENWDAPLVATTSVQFFESLFHHRSGKCRKLHNIARSVVILDEAQMLPSELLLPCLAALRELTERYGASVMLCTATQPALTRNAGLVRGLDDPVEIAPDPRTLFLAPEFRRVRVQRLDAGTDTDLAAHVRQNRQALVVVNTRKHARRLFELLRDATGTHHLSALMCPAHRSAALDQIRKDLDDKTPCLVVSTSLIEAGVDVDFPVVYRASCGVDSLAQAAGRCNREGRLPEPGTVWTFEPEEGPPKGPFKRAATVGQGVLKAHSDPLQPDAVKAYFRELYWLAGEHLDRKNILGKLERNQKSGDYPFREVSEAFRFIEQATRPIIIQYDDEARRLVRELRFAESLGGIARRLQRYTVQVYEPEWKALNDAGALNPVREGFEVLVRGELYSGEAGLDMFGLKGLDPADLIL
ncbi:MAG: CRISPR-associated helicase Cas3' [Desulfovibrio sp.]